MRNCRVERLRPRRSAAFAGPATFQPHLGEDGQDVGALDVLERAVALAEGLRAVRGERAQDRR